MTVKSQGQPAASSVTFRPVCRTCISQAIISSEQGPMTCVLISVNTSGHDTIIYSSISHSQFRLHAIARLLQIVPQAYSMPPGPGRPRNAAAASTPAFSKKEHTRCSPRAGAQITSLLRLVFVSACSIGKREMNMHRDTSRNMTGRVICAMHV